MRTPRAEQTRIRFPADTKLILAKRLPQREQATKAKGRDWWATELQGQGLTFGEARAGGQGFGTWFVPAPHRRKLLK